METTALDHSLDKLVDLVLAIAKVTALHVVIVLLAPSAGRCVELEWPDEVVDLLEDATASVELEDHVLYALDIVSLLQFTLNHEVIGDRNAFAGVLDEASLVEQVADCLQRWVSVGNVGLGNAQHVESGLVELHKGGIVDLSQAKELKDLLYFWCDLVDTKIKQQNLIIYLRDLETIL